MTSRSVTQKTGVGFVTTSRTHTPLKRSTRPASCPLRRSSGSKYEVRSSQRIGHRSS